MENLKIEDLIEGEIYRYDYTNKYAALEAEQTEFLG